MVNEFKPTTFRVSDEVRERFKTLAKAEGWNQDEALSQLIGIYEIDQAKIVLSDRKTEIGTFDMHLQSLSEIYRMSLQLNMDTEARIKTGYADTLLSNQKSIQELQGQIEKLKQDLENAKSYQERNGELEKNIDRIRAEMQKTDTLCQEYKSKNDTLNSLLTEYKADHEENVSLHKQLRDMDKLKAEITALKQQHESALKLNSLELKEKHQEKMDQLKNRHHDELEQATKDYKTVLQELEELRRENYWLKGKLLEQASPAQEKKKPMSTSGRKKTTSTKTTGGGEQTE